MNKLFTTKIKAIICVAAIAIALVVGIVTKFAYSSNAIMAIFMAIGAISVSNIIVSKKYKTDISFPLYMIGNIAGLLVALFVISKASSMDSLYLILFLVIIFIALWIYEMCLINIEGVSKRLVAALVANICVVLLTAVGVLLVVTISVFATVS